MQNIIIINTYTTLTNYNRYLFWSLLIEEDLTKIQAHLQMKKKSSSQEHIIEYP